MTENCDRRALAGIQCVDAITTGSILDPLLMSSSQLTLRPNRSGVYVVWDGPGLHASATMFPATPWPASAPFEIAIQDPSFRYLPRRSKIQVPQPLAAPVTPPQTANYGPQQVTLYPGPAAPVAPNWGVVRASVTSNASPPVPLPWAVLQVLKGTTVMATGLSDPNGEALLAIAGLSLQVSSSAGGPVTEVTVAATVNVWFDPTNLTQPSGWTPNPDDILQALTSLAWKTTSASIQIGPGLAVYVPLTVSL